MNLAFQLEGIFITLYQFFTGLINTGEFIFSTIFNTFGQWLNLYEGNPLRDFLLRLLGSVSFGEIMDTSLFTLMFSPVGMWTVMTILVFYFFIP